MLNFETLDYSFTKGLFYVYAVQQPETSKYSQLVMLQIEVESNVPPRNVATQVVPLGIDQCGEYLGLGDSVIVVICSKSRNLQIIRRSTLEVIYTKEFTLTGNYGETLRVITHKDGV